MKNEIPQMTDTDIDSLTVISENFQGEAEKAYPLEKCRKAHISEYAVFLSRYFDRKEPFFVSESFVNIYRNTVNTVFGHGVQQKNLISNPPDVVYRAELCSILCEIYAQKFISPQIRSFTEKLLSANDYNIFMSDSDNTETENPYAVALLKSVYSDMAFEVFAAEDPALYPSYQTDFDSVCEDVFYNRAGACILPIRTFDDGQLASFRALIDKYDLKITRTCTVSPENGGATVFALLRKNILPVKLSDIGTVKVEIKTLLTEDMTLPSLLIAAEHLGVKVSSVSSLPLFFASELSFSIVFECSANTIPTLLAFLFLEVPQFILYGIYFDINSEY